MSKMKEVFRMLLWNILDEILGFTHTDSQIGRASCRERVLNLV